MKKKKNSNYKANFTKAEAPTGRRNVALIAFVSIFVAVAIIVGAVFGITAAVKNSKAAFKYKNITMSEELASFFVSYYKYEYISMLTRSGVTDAADTEEFWSKKCNTVNTYGEFLEYNTREYIKQILVANYIFDSYARLSAVEKRDIELAAEEILDYHADGSVEKFNEETAEFGFTYSIFHDAAEMLYKATVARDVIFGSDGAKIAQDSESCGKFLSQYSRVRLLFIRSADKFRVDENGKRVTGDDGQDILDSLTAEEIAERAKDVADIRDAISAINEDGDVQMSPELFSHYQTKYANDGDASKNTKGYYFHSNSAFSGEFAEEFPDIVKKSLDEMTVGDYAEVKTSFGTCFIYKCEPEAGAYRDTGEDSCFRDFYELCAVYTFDVMLNELSGDVTVKDRFSNIDIIKTPYNNVFYPRF